MIPNIYLKISIYATRFHTSQIQLEQINPTPHKSGIHLQTVVDIYNTANKWYTKGFDKWNMHVVPFPEGINNCPIVPIDLVCLPSEFFWR